MSDELGMVAAVPLSGSDKSDPLALSAAELLEEDLDDFDLLEDL